MPKMDPFSDPVYWSIAALQFAYAQGTLSPVDVAETILARIKSLDKVLNAYICTLDDLAREQAVAAETAYRRGGAEPLSGIPISVKDTFDMSGYVSTFGSLAFRENVARRDSGAVRRLRAAGAVFVGKTNTAEFGQSATTDNRLGEDCRNPWDIRCTSGGSSGGAAASVAAGLATAALGADGGGSIRIPAAFCGLVGMKPTYGLCKDENGFRGMSDFVCPGPLAWRVSDARIVLGVLADRQFPRQPVGRRLRIAWCSQPEDRPIDPALADVIARSVNRLSQLGHSVEEADIAIGDWDGPFGMLVLAEERRERGHLIGAARGLLSEYEVLTLEAASSITDEMVTGARKRHRAYQAKIADVFDRYDLLVTPATAVPAFPVGKRPREIAGQKVDRLWGAFPFTPQFNVAGTPAVSLPCGFVDHLPVGIQLVTGVHQDALLLDLAEDLEEALNLDRSAVIKKWATPPTSPTASS